MTEQSRTAALAGFLATTWAPEGLREDELALIVTALREKDERDAAPIKAGDDLGNGLVAVDASGPDAEFEIWQDSGPVAMTSGPIDQAALEAAHYAMVYGQDGPVEIKRVLRVPIRAGD